MSKVYVTPDGRERGVLYPLVHGEEWGYGDRVGLRSECWAHVSGVQMVQVCHHESSSSVLVTLSCGRVFEVLDFHADDSRPAGAGVRKADLAEARAEALCFAAVIRDAMDRWRAEQGG